MKSIKLRDGELLSYVTPLRVISIAERLFAMRSLPSFNEICRRLSTRDLRATYFEIRAMGQFLNAGFDVEVRRETGIRGADFDFLAKKGSISIAVEVTALDEKPFRELAIKNALGKKRSQLPSHIPSVIYCLVPTIWKAIRIDLDSHVETAATAFMDGTERVNVVVIAIERHVDGPTPGTGSVSLICKPVTSRRPRHDADLSFLYCGNADVEPFGQSAGAGPGELERPQHHMLRSDFREWVDLLVPDD